jgi:hypothetical protein
MSIFPMLKSWFLQNQTTQQIIRGEFHPVDLTKEVKPNYVTHVALSRTKEIVQFLNQDADTLSFKAVMNNRDGFSSFVEKDYQLLESWARPDPIYGNKPPILTFWVGQGWELMECVITGLSNIRFEEPFANGRIRQISLIVNLRKYEKFSLEGTGNYETRYHRAAVRDYYELLAYREYNNPMLGVVIRNRHPNKPNIQIGDVIKLPSVEAIRKERAQPTSIALRTITGKKITPQKTLVKQMFDNRNIVKVSYTIVS